MSAGTQPITLITATPGGGKTALAVQLIKQAVDAGRPVFQTGIPELKLPHTELPPISEWTEKRVDPDLGVEMPYFCFPPNSLIVVDEAQRIYRVRSAATKVPDHVAAFETVRHTGVTFILITQNPSLIDSHIRGLVGQHIHLRDVGLYGRHYYEWPEIGKVESWSAAPIKKKWKLPKESFALYKSSSMHIKRDYTVPPAMIWLGLILVALAFLSYRIYHKVNGAIHPEKAVVKTDKVKNPLGSGSGPAASGAPTSGAPVAKTAAEMIAQEIPVRPGHPESAPMYAGMLQVKDVPRVSGAMQVGNEYHCYTQQGTDAGLDNMQCKAWMKHRPFDPYKDPGKDAPVNAVSAPPAAPMPVSNPAPAPVPETSTAQQIS